MISIIVAVAENGVIGGDNSLLWHISEDLKRFKAITSGHPVIMGRKTYDSLGRALPNRKNVVITRQEIAIDGVVVVHSLSEAVSLFDEQEEIFIIGGAQIYGEAMDIADKFYLTVVHHDYDGDTKYPEWNRDQWQLIESESLSCGKEYQYPFTFETYTRIG